MKLVQFKYVLLLALLAGSSTLLAQDVLIRNATVHTGTSAGVLKNTDVLVQGGKIVTVGKVLATPAAIKVVDAKERPLTAGLFAGITALGLEEVPAEAMTVDSSLAMGAALAPQDVKMRPEFEVSIAFNPHSALIPVNRMEGLTFTLLGAGTTQGGSIIGGQGAAARLDGSYDVAMSGSQTLFLDLGSDTSALTGNSRAAQYMLLAQAIREARTNTNGDDALLTVTGRETLLKYLNGGRWVVHVDRAADIRRVLEIAKREKFNLVLSGAAEAWMLAKEIAAANVPVLIDPLVNLPGNFDSLASSAENAKRLHAAGVQVAFTQGGDASHNARKIRQVAGNAVANGLPWDAALAALTSVPAKILGIDAQIGTIATGKIADLVLWSGDPLEVSTLADQVWLAGKADSMRSRQTELRDRYLNAEGALPRQYTHD